MACLWKGCCQVFKNIVKCFTCDACVLHEVLTFLMFEIAIPGPMNFLVSSLTFANAVSLSFRMVSVSIIRSLSLTVLWVEFGLVFLGGGGNCGKIEFSFDSMLSSVPHGRMGNSVKLDT